MNNFIVSCCSPADITNEYVKERNIAYTSFTFTIGGKNFLDDLGKSIGYAEFYQAMRDGAETKTSQVNESQYCDYFRGLLSSGKDVVHVCLSSGLSGTSNSAFLAKREIEAEFPNQKLYIIDSLGASGGYGLLVDKLCDLRDEGMSAKDAFDWIEKNKLKLHHWFYSTDLTFFVKGGRISKVSGWFGTLLKICPLLNVSFEGKLVPRHKIRGKKSVMKAIVDKMIQHAEGGLDYDQKCFITHSDCIDDAREVEKVIRETFPKIKEISVNSIGTTIGCHTGPGTLALFFWGDERKD